MDDNATHGQTVGSEDIHVDEPDWLDEGCRRLTLIETGQKNCYCRRRPSFDHSPLRQILRA